MRERRTKIWSDSDFQFLSDNWGKMTTPELADAIDKPYNSVVRYCSERGISHKQGGFTEEEKKEIIRLYSQENRGKKYIGALFNRSDFTITRWLNRWGVPTLDRKVIAKKLREVYGPTKGFSGRTHTKKSRTKISQSGKDAWGEGREVVGRKSQTFSTIIGPVLGTYEVAYLQKLVAEGQELPSVARKRLKTPFGSYKPDFEFSDRYIEVKSEYTLALGKGEHTELNSHHNELQMKKLEYVSAHVKKVEIVVLTKKEAYFFFRSASKEKGILCAISL